MKLRAVLLMGLIWALLVTGFQVLASLRFGAQPPDRALEWTPSETTPGSHVNRPYVLDPFMNHAVAWDSEFYLSIAIAGYDDPHMAKIDDHGRPLSKSYAFLPFYPVMIKFVALPFRLFLEPIAAASVAGVIVSMAGAVAAAAALFLLAGGMKTTGPEKRLSTSSSFPPAFSWRRSIPKDSFWDWYSGRWPSSNITRSVGRRSWPYWRCGPRW